MKLRAAYMRPLQGDGVLAVHLPGKSPGGINPSPTTYSPKKS